MSQEKEKGENTGIDTKTSIFHSAWLSHYDLKFQSIIFTAQGM